MWSSRMLYSFACGPAASAWSRVKRERGGGKGREVARERAVWMAGK